MTQRRPQHQPHPHRTAKLRRTLLNAFVWVLLAAFVLTSVGVALVNFAGH